MTGSVVAIADWKQDYPNYHPVTYNHPAVLAQPPWADVPAALYAITQLSQSFVIVFAGCRTLLSISTRTTGLWTAAQPTGTTMSSQACPGE